LENEIGEIETQKEKNKLKKIGENKKINIF